MGCREGERWSSCVGGVAHWAELMRIVTLNALCLAVSAGTATERMRRNGRLNNQGEKTWTVEGVWHPLCYTVFCFVNKELEPSPGHVSASLCAYKTHIYLIYFLFHLISISKVLFYFKMPLKLYNFLFLLFYFTQSNSKLWHCCD